MLSLSAYLTASPAGALLPTGDATPAPGTIDPDKVQPGLLGFAFFVVLASAVLLLVMSMRKHLRRIDITKHQQVKLAKAAATAAADGRAAAAAAAASGQPVPAGPAAAAPAATEAKPPSEAPPARPEGEAREG